MANTPEAIDTSWLFFSSDNCYRNLISRRSGWHYRTIMAETHPFAHTYSECALKSVKTRMVLTEQFVNADF